MNFPLRKLAAIDIGSNAVRCQISAVLYYEGRYRLKRVSEVIGWDATGARESLILQAALIIGSIAEPDPAARKR